MNESNETILCEKDQSDTLLTNADVKEVGLKRELNLLRAICLLVGTMIGSGIFASPSSVTSQVNSEGASLLVWTGCGVLSMLAALSWIELGTTFPNVSGGEYAYLFRAFGPLPAFLFTFVKILVMRPSALCLITLTCGNYLVEAILRERNNTYAKIAAMGCIVVITVVNCWSVKWATGMQVFFTVAKMIAIVMLIITGFVRLGQGYDENFKDAFNGTNTGVSDISYAFYGGLWAYGGWDILNYVTEEIKNPIRNLPLAIIIGIPLVTGCYAMVNVAYFTVMTSAQITKSNAVAVTLGYDLYGKAAFLIPLLVACSTFGAANGSAFASGRLVCVSARKGHLPKLLAMVHKKRRTPLPALLFTCLIALIMLIPKSSSFATLLTYFNFANWTFYGATIVGLLWLRFKEPKLKRPYKVFIGIPIVVLLCSVYLVVAPFSDYPEQSSYCLLFILFAIPVYFAFIRFKIFPKFIYDGFDNLTMKIEKLCNLGLPNSEEVDTDEINEVKEKIEKSNVVDSEL